MEPDQGQAALDKLKQSREIRDTGNHAQAKVLLGEARAMAHALGKQEGQADKLPELFKDEPILKDSYQDGVKELAKSMQKGRGMSL